MKTRWSCLSFHIRLDITTAAPPLAGKGVRAYQGGTDLGLKPAERLEQQDEHLVRVRLRSSPCLCHPTRDADHGWGRAGHAYRLPRLPRFSSRLRNSSLDQLLRLSSGAMERASSWMEYHLLQLGRMCTG